jgi:hypothetical protein
MSTSQSSKPGVGLTIRRSEALSNGVCTVATTLLVRIPSMWRYTESSLSPSILQDVQYSDFGNGLRAALHVELATDIEDVFFRGVNAEDEVIGDLAVGRAIYQQAQHLPLPLSQVVDHVAMTTREGSDEASRILATLS